MLVTLRLAAHPVDLYFPSRCGDDPVYLKSLLRHSASVTELKLINDNPEVWQYSNAETDGKP